MPADAVDVAILAARTKLAHLEGRGCDVKRDMELVRTIFRTIIDRTDLRGQEIAIEGFAPDVVRRHMEMLYNEGYIDGSHFDSISDGRRVKVRDLSWKGHEFAGAILTDDGTWQKVKAAFGPEKLATAPFKMIESVATQALTAWAMKQAGL